MAGTFAAEDVRVKLTAHKTGGVVETREFLFDAGSWKFQPSAPGWATGGGAQTPGFVGVGRLYLSSPKFLSSDGGVKRLVWMPKALKEGIRDRFEKEAERIGEPGLLDKVATEEDAMTEEDVAEYLAKVEHPALALDPLM